MDTKMFDYFMIAIGAYLFVSGIRGKGDMLYKNDSIHRSQKRAFYTMMRRFGLIAGPLCAASGALSVFTTSPSARTISMVIAGLFGLVILYTIVQTVRMSERHIQKRCAKTGESEPPSDGWEEEHPSPKKQEAAPKAAPIQRIEEEMADFEPRSFVRDGEPRKVEQDDIRFF